MLYIKNLIKQKEINVFLCHLVKELSFFGNSFCSFCIEKLRRERAKPPEASVTTIRNEVPVSSSRSVPYAVCLHLLAGLSANSSTAFASREMSAHLGSFLSFLPQVLRTGGKRRASSESCGQRAWGGRSWTRESAGPGLHHHLCPNTLAK